MYRILRFVICTLIVKYVPTRAYSKLLFFEGGCDGWGNCSPQISEPCGTGTVRHSTTSNTQYCLRMSLSRHTFVSPLIYWCMSSPSKKISRCFNASPVVRGPAHIEGTQTRETTTAVAMTGNISLRSHSRCHPFPLPRTTTGWGDSKDSAPVPGKVPTRHNSAPPARTRISLRLGLNARQDRYLMQRRRVVVEWAWEGRFCPLVLIR